MSGLAECHEFFGDRNPKSPELICNLPSSILIISQLSEPIHL